jgi:hypothetical protein
MTCALLLLASLAGRVSAQFEDEPPRIVVGPMVGVSFSTLRGADVGDADVRSGVTAGGFLTLTFTTYFALEPQLLYTQKGANYHADSAGVSLSTATTLTYIELPLLFKARYPVGTGKWPLMFSAIAGPAIGINIGCQYIDDDGRSTKCGDRDLGPNMTDPEATGLDFSAIFGVGISYYHFAFQARYDYSFNSIYTSSNSPFSSTPDIKNQAWALTLGYKIEIN